MYLTLESEYKNIPKGYDGKVDCPAGREVRSADSRDFLVLGVFLGWASLTLDWTA